MNAIATKLVGYLLRKYKEPSSWLGVVVALFGYFHFNASPGAVASTEQIFADVVAFLLVMLNEHPGGTAGSGTSGDSVVRDGSQASAGSQPASVPAVSTVNRADLPPEKRGNDADRPRPVRPGFDRTS